MQYLLILHKKSGYTKAPQCYVVRTLPVLFLVHYSSTNSLSPVRFLLPKNQIPFAVRFDRHPRRLIVRASDHVLRSHKI
jgi:hypothetical protein